VEFGLQYDLSDNYINQIEQFIKMNVEASGMAGMQIDLQTMDQPDVGETP